MSQPSPGRSALHDLGLPPPSAPPPSVSAFPDGGAWRLEIPSVEGPEALAVVLQAAQEAQLPVHRVSQGSGVDMLGDSEITDMVQAAADGGVELCLFARPGANWDPGAGTAGPAVARSRGASQLSAAIAEVERAADLGVRSVLVADEGLLWSLHLLRTRGVLPADLQLKVSVMAAPANPASLRVHEHLGADTVNVPSDLTVHHLAELRSASPVTMDFYVEAPDTVGGFVRHHEIADIIAVAAPLYVKFGLRNAPDIYPSGRQLRGAVLDSARERVRRARLCLDRLAREPHPPRMSPLGERRQPTARRFPPPAAQ